MTTTMMTINHRPNQRILPQNKRRRRTPREGEEKEKEKTREGEELPPAITTEPLKKSTRNRQSALSNAFGSPVLINAINNTHDEERKGPIQFQIDSPPDKRDNYPSLKSLI